ncbi:hypothetical protein PFICI_05945 [Pestalotiopsis fici W106-1]|uniref:Uncharacterized protein n=1 Tax=Pestalotiopsis fici (strain W106-1 / CGMCC3.15140) TaxID=1229662 RepID=W3XDH3_PESFW|nr:uncharacterized protein PFICI_05945 [Pestalotiopsis fici W106-1]ETS84069.1 hypothetical protein PFICI_05945 [Pestalotiopsis fici W106-1]
MYEQGETYDLIFMRETLEVKTEVAAAAIIQKAARLLKPGGYFEVQTFVRYFERCKVGNASDLVGDVFERAKELGQAIISTTPWKSLMEDAGLETQQCILSSSTFTDDFAAFLPEYLDGHLPDLAPMAAEALKCPGMENSIRL